MKLIRPLCLFAVSIIMSAPLLNAQAPAEDDGMVVVRNQLSKEDERDPKTGGFRKLHIIDLQAGKGYKIRLDSVGKSFKPHVRVEDEDGKVLADDGEGTAPDRTELNFAPLTDGKYRVVATSRAAGETGVYALTISKGEAATSVQFAGALAANDPIDKVRQGCHHKVFVHKMLAGRVYTIDLQGQFDTYIRVESSAGVNLAEDDDGGDGLNSRLVFRPQQNDSYRVIVTSCGPGAVGPFKLNIVGSGSEKIVLQANSQLTQQDPVDKVRQGSHCKTYTLKLESGKNYVIDLESNQFDSYLRLEDAAGANLAQDDDGGSGLNSRINFRPTQTGMYRVIATTLGQGSVGNFSLTVRQP